jgi:hypothetical protein
VTRARAPWFAALGAALMERWRELHKHADALDVVRKLEER